MSKIVKAAPRPDLTSWVNQFGTICLCFLSGGGGGFVNAGISGERGKSRGRGQGQEEQWRDWLKFWSSLKEGTPRVSLGMKCRHIFKERK